MAQTIRQGLPQHSLLNSNSDGHCEAHSSTALIEPVCKHKTLVTLALPETDNALVGASGCQPAVQALSSTATSARLVSHCVRCHCTTQVNLKCELEAGWALRAGQQATALKEAQAKVAALEHSLQQVRPLTTFHSAPCPKAVGCPTVSHSSAACLSDSGLVDPNH